MFRYYVRLDACQSVPGRRIEHHWHGPGPEDLRHDHTPTRQTLLGLKHWYQWYDLTCACTTTPKVSTFTKDELY